MRKESGAEAPEFMNVLVHEGRVVITDYSHTDEYNTVLALFGAVGLPPTVTTESWCG